MSKESGEFAEKAINVTEAVGITGFFGALLLAIPAVGVASALLIAGAEVGRGELKRRKKK